MEQSIDHTVRLKMKIKTETTRSDLYQNESVFLLCHPFIPVKVFCAQTQGCNNAHSNKQEVKMVKERKKKPVQIASCF